MIKNLNLSSLVRKDVLALAAPVFAEQALINLLGVVNSILSSRLSPETAAAIGMVDGVNLLVLGMLQALALGTTVIVAHYHGQGNRAMVRVVSRQTFAMTLAVGSSVGLILFCLGQPLLEGLYRGSDPAVLELSHQYFSIVVLVYPLSALVTMINGRLRGSGDTVTPAKVMVLMNVLNVVLSAFLIYGLPTGDGYLFGFGGLGIRGAALGVTLAWAVGTAVLVTVLFRLDRPRSEGPLPPFKIDRATLRVVFGVGIPASLESGLFNVGKLLTQTFIVGMGTAAMAANTIGFSVQLLFTIPGNALGIVATTMTGNYLGRGDVLGARKVARYLTLSGTALLAVLCLFVCVIFAPTIVSLYTGDAEVLRQTVDVLNLLFPFVFFWGFSGIMPAALKGAGDARFTLLVSMASMWGVRVILGWVLGVQAGLGLSGLWLAMFLDWAARAVAFGLRYRGQGWTKKKLIAAG